MSFGFGVGDFLAVAKIAKTIYTDVYRVSQTASSEMGRLEREMASLTGSLGILIDDITNEESVVQKAGPDRFQLARDAVGNIKETLLDLQTIVEKYNKKFDPKRGRFKRGWSKVEFAMTDAKEIDIIRNRLGYHNTVMGLLINSINTGPIKRVETSNSMIQDGVNKIISQVCGTSATPLMSKRHGMEDEVFNASLSADLLRYAEIERPWASIGLFDWIQAGKWWLIKYQSEYGGNCSQNKPLLLRTYLHLVKSAWILCDLIVVHPQRSHLNETVALEIETLVTAISEEFDRIKSRQMDIPCLDDVDDNDLEIWEKYKGAATLQPGQRREEGLRNWIMREDLIIYQKFAEYKDGNSSSVKTTTALILLLVNKKTKATRLIVHDQSWACLAEYTDTALMENKATIEYSSKVPKNVLFDSHSFTFSSESDAEIFHGILVAESHLIRPYSSYFTGSSKQMHYVFYLLHGLLERSKSTVQHFYSAALDLPLTTLSNAEQSLYDAILQHSNTFINRPDDSAEPVKLNTQSNVLIQRLAVSDFNDIARFLAALRGITLSESIIQSKLSPRDALKERRTDIFQLLLDSDQRIIYDYVEEAPDDLLSLAISLGLAEEVKMIAAVHQRMDGLEAALTRTSKPGELRTVLSWLAEHWNCEIFETLFSGFEKALPGDTADKTGRYPLHWASENGHIDAVCLLISRSRNISFSINMPGAQNRRPLHNAAKGGHEAAVRMLLATPVVWADVGDINQDSPLILACESGHLGVVKILANHPDIDINYKSVNSSPLMAASFYRHRDIIEFLLSLPSIDLNLKDRAGRTALAMAGYHGDEAIIKLFLDHPKLQLDKQSHELLLYAAERGHANVIKLLTEKNPSDLCQRDKQGQTSLHYAAKFDKTGSCVKYLLSRPEVDPNAKMAQDATPLIYAVKAGNIEAVRLLLERKDVDVNWKAKHKPYHQTALMLSAISAREDIAELLLQREDIDVNLKDTDVQFTALHYAAVHGYGEGVLRRILAHKDANPTLLTSYCQTPLDACIASGPMLDAKKRRIKSLEDAVVAWEKRQQDMAYVEIAQVNGVQIQEKVELMGRAAEIMVTASSQ